MKVYELIEALKLCDIGKEVYVFKNSEIEPLNCVDELSDRVDLNIQETL